MLIIVFVHFPTLHRQVANKWQIKLHKAMFFFLSLQQIIKKYAT